MALLGAPLTVAALLALLITSAQTSPPPADGEAETAAGSEEPAESVNPTEAQGETTEEPSPDTTADSPGDPSQKSEEHTDAPSHAKGSDAKDAKKKSSSHYLTAFPLAMGAGFVIAQQLL